jgi:tetratricopeptide (TPR) repeat protein/CHAT domain-containing protein
MRRERLIGSGIIIALFYFALAPLKEPGLVYSETARAQAQADASITEVVTGYFASIGREDLEANVSLWSAKSPFLAARVKEIQALFDAGDYTLSNLVISAVESEDGRAILEARADLSGRVRGRESTEKLARKIALIKEDGAWKIWRDAPASEHFSLAAKDPLWNRPDDLSVVDEFAASLAAAPTDADRAGLLTAGSDLVKTDLWLALIRRGGDFKEDGKYADALKTYLIARDVAERMGDKARAFSTLLDIGNLHQTRGSHDLALENFNRALAYFEATGDDARAVEALDYIGQSHLARRSFGPALDAYKKMLAFFEKSSNRVGMADALDNIANVYYSLGDFRPALEFFKKSLALRETVRARADVAASLNNIGNAYYQQGDYGPALENYGRARALFERLQQAAGVAAALHNIGSVQYSQGNYESAVRSYEKRLAIEEAEGNREGIDSAISSIALARFSQGNYDLALDYYEQSLKLRRALGDKKKTADALRGIGLIRHRLGDYGAALEAYKESLALAEEMMSEADASSASRGIADVYYALGDYAAALKSYNDALARYEALGEKREAANALASIGNALYALGEYEAALGSYRRGLAQAESIGDIEGVAGALSKMAGVYLSQHLYAQAIEYSSRAAALSAQVDDAETLWRARFTAGASYRALKNFAQARAALDESISAVETARDRTRRGESGQRSSAQDQRAPYLAMVELLLGENSLAEAFHYAERAKNNDLEEVMGIGKVGIDRGLSAYEQAQERKAKDTLASLSSQINREGGSGRADPKRVSPLRTRLRTARLQYAALLRRIYAAHPDLPARRGEVEAVSAEEAASLSGSTRTALLEFTVMEDRTYLFALTGDSEPAPAKPEEEGQQARPRSSSVPPSGRNGRPSVLNVYAIDITRKELVDRVGRFREALARGDDGFEPASRELYEILLKPASKQLEGKASICVVPDSSLWSLPFPALKSSRDRFLVEDHAISYVPSFSALRLMGRRRAKPAPGRSQVELLAVDGSLPEGRAGEARRVADLYGPRAGRVIEGAQAREERVKSEAAKALRLHFSAPCVIDDRSPLYSDLRLARKGEARGEDGRLQAWEIAGLALAADLVALSSCERVGPAAGSGEGTIAMSWAFAASGCGEFVMSQWRADPAVTEELMLDFHREIRKGRRAAVAMQLAASRLIESDSLKHPRYWSGFAVIAGPG